MKVVRKDWKKATTFEELLPGTVFEDDGDVYLKIYIPSSAEYQAVELESGMIGYFPDKVKVTPLDAELIVKGECE